MCSRPVKRRQVVKRRPAATRGEQSPRPMSRALQGSSCMKLLKQLASEELDRVSERIETQERASSGEPVASVGRVSTDAPGNPKRIVAGKRFSIERRPRAGAASGDEVAVGNGGDVRFETARHESRGRLFGVLVLGVMRGLRSPGRILQATAKYERGQFSIWVCHLSFPPKRLKTSPQSLRCRHKSCVTKEEDRDQPRSTGEFPKGWQRPKTSGSFVLVLGLLDERQNFPSWIADLWNPEREAQSTRPPNSKR